MVGRVELANVALRSSIFLSIVSLLYLAGGRSGLFHFHQEHELRRNDSMREGELEVRLDAIVDYMCFYGRTREAARQEIEIAVADHGRLEFKVLAELLSRLVPSSKECSFDVATKENGYYLAVSDSGDDFVFFRTDSSKAETNIFAFRTDRDLGWSTQDSVFDNSQYRVIGCSTPSNQRYWLPGDCFSVGSLEAGVSYSKTGFLFNLADVSLTITSLKTTCGCVSIVKHPEIIGAGECGQFELKVTPKSSTAQLDFAQRMIATTDHEPITVPIRGQLLPELLLRPSIVSVSNLPPETFEKHVEVQVLTPDASSTVIVPAITAPGVIICSPIAIGKNLISVPVSLDFSVQRQMKCAA